MKKSTIIIIVVVALLAIWGVSGYNGPSQAGCSIMKKIIHSMNAMMIS